MDLKNSRFRSLTVEVSLFGMETLTGGFSVAPGRGADLITNIVDGAIARVDN